MVYRCCVPGCRTGYKTKQGKSRNTKAVRAEIHALYKFPKDKELRQKWIRSIPRQSWIVTSQHRVCRKHFKLKDFEKYSSDTNNRRRVRRDSQRLARLRLKNSAVPCIFTGLAPTLTKATIENKTETRPKKHSTSARIEKDKVGKDKPKPGLLQYDIIEDVACLKEIMREKTLPDGYIMSDRAESLQFHYIESDEDSSVSPKLSASVIVKKNLGIGVFIKSSAVPLRVYSHLLKSDCLQNASELSNILSLCKTLSQQDLLSNDETVLIDMAASHLQRYLGCELNATNKESHISLIKFVIEQLALIQQPKHGRHYSADLIFQAFSWKLTSATCYKELQDFFLLPCDTQLRRLSTAMTVESCRQALEYLKERGANVSDTEMANALMDNKADSE